MKFLTTLCFVLLATTGQAQTSCFVPYPKLPPRPDLPYFPPALCPDSALIYKSVYEIHSMGESKRVEVPAMRNGAFVDSLIKYRIQHQYITQKPDFFRVTPPEAILDKVFQQAKLPVLSNAYSGKTVFRLALWRSFSGGLVFVTLQRNGRRCFVETRQLRYVFSKRDGLTGSEVKLEEFMHTTKRLSRRDFAAIEAAWRDPRVACLSPKGWRDTQHITLSDGPGWLLEAHLPEGYRFVSRPNFTDPEGSRRVEALGKQLLALSAAREVRP